MISLLKKISNNIFFKLFITLLILTYFYNNLDFNIIKNSIKSIDLRTLFISLLILSINPLLFILRWFYVVNYFQKEKFINFYIQISKGLIIAELLQNSIFLDLYKFYKLKKLNLKNKLLLIINEKIIILFTRVSFILVLFTLINFYIFKISIFLNLILLVLMLIILIYIFLNIKNFKEKFILNIFYNYYIKFFTKKIISRKKIFAVELLRNIILSLSYFIISINFFDLKTALAIMVLGPLIELILKIQFFSVIGVRELLFYLLGQSTIINENLLITSSIIISFLFMITNMVNYLFSKFFIFLKKSF